ncbi:DUF305 domain-containing protein [Streptomyces sp. NBRC 109706]|uniref:DUF305 domain-containing protein n=1 Tax=Streptomyces sp. NBRC 109706 TaxID=1550035 RepID=UPI00078069D3|nr:DUF305 domain-containing protein [Streptomyces sp. NBRC 109706]
MSINRTRTRTGLPALAVALGLALTACGGGDGGDGADTTRRSGPESVAAADPAGPNAADVAFAQLMIPHHQQALDMAGLAADRAADPEVLALAERIGEAQGPEIATLDGWLTEWNQGHPADGGQLGDHGPQHDHGEMSGMLTDDELTALARAEGPAFDTAFLTLMIEHHEGALEMAERQLAEGAYQPALELAEEIVAGQRAEIELMTELLGAD